jgi:hypothetical protein
MVKLVARKAVVDQQQRAALQAVAPLRGPGARSQADLAFVARRQSALTADLGGCRQQGAAGRPLAPGEAGLAGELDTALADGLFAPGDDVRRHRVEQFVADDYTGERRGQAVEPADARQQVGNRLREGLLLPLTQVGREIENFVAFRQLAEIFEFGQQVRRQPTGAGAGLEHHRCRQGHDLRHLPGQRPAEQRAHAGRRDEIAGGAELHGSSRVIAEPRFVEQHVHEAGKRNPAAPGIDFAGDRCHQAAAVREGIGGRGGEAHGVSGMAPILAVNGESRRQNVAISR